MANVRDLISVISRWALIRQRYLDDPITPADIDHSSLLRRLLEGKEPFVEVPPRRFSYPEYALAEGCSVHVMDVWFGNEHHPIVDEDQCVIDQSVWNILERNKDGSFIVRWHGNEKAKYKLTPLSEEEKTTFCSWSLKRLDEPEYLENVYQ